MIIVVCFKYSFESKWVKFLHALIDSINDMLSISLRFIALQFPELCKILPYTACRVEFHVMFIGKCWQHNPVGLVESGSDSAVTDHIHLLHHKGVWSHLVLLLLRIINSLLDLMNFVVVMGLDLIS
jgi:hypothetical protein